MEGMLADPDRMVASRNLSEFTGQSSQGKTSIGELSCEFESPM